MVNEAGKFYKEIIMSSVQLLRLAFGEEKEYLFL